MKLTNSPPATRRKFMKKVITAAIAAGMAAVCVPGVAYEKGDWILRAGATTVDPDATSDDIELPTGLVARADVDDNTQLGIIPVYMIDDHWGLELLAATPFEHDVKAQGRGEIDGVGLDAGSIKHLPPTLMVQWYPRGGKSGWQPYLGFGANYTIIYDEDVDSELIGLLGQLTDGAVDDANLDLDNSFGLAGQAGVDIPFGERWAFNISVWYLDIDSDAEITAVSGGENLAKVKFDVEIDPWVYNIGIAYRF
ncbi:MAG: OmpW family outer membrane protein [Halioglobus sp.]|nr:OmpW family outer membrane protein [Halioglobus sp.]